MVDDNAAYRRILARDLAALGLVARQAASPAEALEVFAEASPDLALIDLRIPGANVRGLVQSIRANPQWLRPRIVLLPSVGLLACLGQADPNPWLGSASPRPAAEGGQRPLRILLAEDNPVNHRLALKLLEREGHSVVHASDGRAAVERWREERFDLMLMDVQMPGKHGLQATRRIRELEGAGGPRTVIVAMTAHAMKGDEDACLQAGMDGYLSKPIQRERFLSALAQHARPALAEASWD